MIVHSIETLHARCDEVGDCWEWTGCYSKTGHPCTRHDGKMVLVRRLMAQLAGKPITPSIKVIPCCENGRCINPDHIVVRTHRQVMKRQGAMGKLSEPSRLAKIAATKRAGPQAKLTWEKVQAIRARETTHSEEARLHGVSIGVISAIRRHLRWKEYEGNPWAGLGART